MKPLNVVPPARSRYKNKERGMQENTIEMEGFNEPSAVSEIISQERFSEYGVLLVDDDERWIKILTRWFQGTPYKCHFAADGMEALEILEKGEINIVISDMSMPRLSGGELMKIIRERYPDISRVIMSGKFEVMSTIDAINQGNIHQYIVKPCENKDLKLVVYKILQTLELKEKQEIRNIEIRQSAVERIKTMGKLVGQMNSELGMVHEGIMQLTQTVGDPGQLQLEQHIQFMVILTEICNRLKLKDCPTRQLELAAVFLRLSSISPGSIQFDEDGQVSFNTLTMEPKTMAVQSSEVILEKLGSSIASQIVKQFASFHGDSNLTMDDDGVTVGSALLVLALDLYVLKAEFDINVFEGLKVLEPHAGRYGTDIYHEVLLNFGSDAS
ncbi:MAG: CheY-like chemotaxis protein [Granulosicoccus sp.]|jgi:CheY-like chemotaxis protein